MNWVAFENFIGEEIPQCVKRVLIICGYDSLFSLCELKETHIETIENYITANHMETIKAFNCCHSNYYKNVTIFRFLSGHAAIVSAIPKYVEKYKNVHKSSNFDPKGRYSFILEEMIRTAEANLFKDPNHASYSDTIRYFATYIFLLCGRSCYEMLRANLPLPSTKTIRKCISENVELLSF